jgi:hypothetical protein
MSTKRHCEELNLRWRISVVISKPSWVELKYSEKVSDFDIILHNHVRDILNITPHAALTLKVSRSPY